MPDIVAPEVRSRMMSGIRGKDTKPEILIRKGLHRRGFRYSLHSKTVTGKPDIVLPRWNAVIFVHGCFWHKHDCHLFKMPASRPEFWRKKFNANLQRDKLVRDSLLESGWRILTIWECALKGKARRRLDDVFDEAEKWMKGETESFEIRGIE